MRDVMYRDSAARWTDGAGVVRAHDARTLDGIAVPYGQPTRFLDGTTETIMAGAFRESVARWNARADARPAYLRAHGGEVVAAVVELRDTPEGVRFRAELMRDEHDALTPAAAAYVAQVRAGVTGASVEMAPRRTHPTRDGYAVDVADLLAIAGSHAPAYDAARIVARDQGGAPMRCVTCGGPVHAPGVTCPRSAPIAFGDRLATLRSDAEAEARSIASVATTEGRAMTAEEDAAHRDAQERAARLGRQHDAYTAERDRLTREQSAVAGIAPSGTIRVTRHEAVYRGRAGESYFADLVGEARGDRASAERLGRHRALVTDLAGQLAERTIESSDISGAYPTQYMPDLYVPDLTYTGPLSAFFASTPIDSARPIVVPAFDGATSSGDTGRQTTENTALPNVDTSTKPLSVTPVTIGGESIVARQVVDGASPGADQIIGGRLRELLMRDREREIAVVLDALTSAGAIADTAGTGAAQSGRDLARGVALAVATMFSTRFLPAEGTFLNTANYLKLMQGEDSTGRPIVPMINPMNSNATADSGFTGAVIGGAPTALGWALAAASAVVVARRNDARQWQSAVLDIRLVEREGPQSVVFAVWQYFAYAVLEPAGVKRWTYTDA